MGLHRPGAAAGHHVRPDRPVWRTRSDRRRRHTRFSLSGRVAQTDDAGSWKANAYLIKYTLDLYNNFEWNTANVLTQIGVPIPTTNCWNPVVCSPLYGDQFHQRDDRVLGGVNASRTYQYTYAGLP